MRKYIAVLLFAFIGVLFTGLAAYAQTTGPAETVKAAYPEPVAAGRYKMQGTSSQQLKAKAGVLVGVFVAQSTACTLKLWDNTAASGTVLVDTFNATAATWYPLPFVYATGLFVTVGGTCSYTFTYY